MKNTSVALGEHFDSFIAQQVASGRYRSASEVMRAGLRLLEHEDMQRAAIVRALVEGEESGFSELTPEDIRKQAKKELQREGVL